MDYFTQEREGKRTSGVASVEKNGHYSTTEGQGPVLTLDPQIF